MVIKAIGGRENIEKVKTLHTVMNMSFGGMNVTMDNKWSREGGRLTKSETPFGNSEMGTDGTTAWTKLPDGSYMILGEEQVGQLDSQASMHMGMLDLKEFQKNMDRTEVVGREEFNGRMAYKLRFEPKDSEGHGFMYFDVNDGMPLGLKQTDSTPMGEQTTTMTLGEWKTVEGVKFFHTMKVQAPGMPGGSAEMKVTTLEVNKLDEGVFALPAQVKELAANSEEADEGGNEEAAADEIKLEDLPESVREQIKQSLAAVKQGGAQAIEAAVQQYERALPQIPEGDMKLQLQYMIQELKKAK
jgi:outer membrane lipoprotein-sorting protein